MTRVNFVLGGVTGRGADVVEHTPAQQCNQRLERVVPDELHLVAERGARVVPADERLLQDAVERGAYEELDVVALVSLLFRTRS